MINLYNGDCLEIMKNIQDKSIDMILCDLPYGITACKWDAVIPFEPLWEQYNRIIKDNGAILLFGSEPFSSYLRMSNIKNYKYDWVWIKEIGTGFMNANKRPLKKNENILVFYKKQPFYNPYGERLEKPYTRVASTVDSKVYNINKSICMKNIDANGRKKVFSYEYKKKHNILEFSRQTRGCLHPNQKPVALLEYLIKTYTNENETVLDNCMGSGSTGVACKNLNRNFIGIELDNEYFEIAKRRIEND